MSPKWKFILIYGLSWGLLPFLSITAWNIWHHHRSITWVDGLMGILIWPFAGLLFGSLMWSRKQSGSL
jgi:hypothetical protein